MPSLMASVIVVEVMQLFGINPYGCILFSSIVLVYSLSSPTIKVRHLGSRKPSEPDKVIVYGSVAYLIQDIRRLLRNVQDQIDENNATPSNLIPTQVVQAEKAVLHSVPDGRLDRRMQFEFARRLVGTLILISTQAGNLLQLFPRLDREIGLFDRNRNQTDTIALGQLFIHFVHSRSLVFDGEHVSDLFPAQPRRGASISRTCMGYRFNWIEYVQSIESVIREVKLKDLTGLLRGRLKELSLQSPYSDIVFLVQNLHSFSRLFEAKPMGGQRYRAMLDLLFKEESKACLDSLMREPGVGSRVHVTVAYNSPHIAIHEDLSERKFKVRVRSKWSLHDRNGCLIYEDRDFRKLVVEVGYEQLLDRVNRMFGNDPLLDFHP